MYAQLEKLVTIRNVTDSDLLRRGRNFIMILLGLIIVDSLLSVLWLYQGQASSAVAAVIMLGIFIVALVMVRRGFIFGPSVVLIGAMIITIIGVITTDGLMNDTPFFLLLPLAIAGAILMPRHIWAVFFVAMLGFMAVTAYVFQSKPPSNIDIINAMDVVSLSLIMTLISYLTSRNTVIALRETQLARQHAETLASRLENMNSALEAEVSLRTSELMQALNSQQEQAQALQNSLEQQQALNDMINQLSLPIIPVRQDVLVAPLIGTLDKKRAQHVIDTILQHIERSHVRVVILDVTGVAMVDTQLAQTMIQLTHATRLLGAKTILVGIRPEVAQILASLNTDLSHLQSAATLQESLAMTM